MWDGLPGPWLLLGDLETIRGPVICRDRASFILDRRVDAGGADLDQRAENIRRFIR